MLQLRGNTGQKLAPVLAGKSGDARVVRATLAPEERRLLITDPFIDYPIGEHRVTFLRSGAKDKAAELEVVAGK
jgi:hypothetical protein